MTNALIAKNIGRFNFGQNSCPKILTSEVFGNPKI